MLYRKLVKAGLLSGVLFCILAAVNATDLTVFNGSTQPEDTTLNLLSFDSAQLKIDGIDKEDSIEVPEITVNRKATIFVKDYISKNRLFLSRLKDEHANYFDIMDTVFTQHGIPVELKYLAIIESRLRTQCVSPAGAAGAWQLMPVAAKMYSLKIKGKYDERKDFQKSTIAAAKLLKDLHAKFGDWLLVVAAYNSGPGGVLKAIKRSGSRNFWKLHDFLPAETRAHVKRFIGVHYYYEENGSIATVTKDEVPALAKKMSDFVLNHNRELQLQMDSKEEAASIAPAKMVESSIASDKKVRE